ncbi:MAG: type II secretion system protein [Planctomycetota bacterium]
MLHSFRGRVGRGFTLIELLVVIAIIAVLIGILLPTLGKARRAGRQAVTLARLHDLGIGTFAYATDYKDRNPTLRDNEERAFTGLSLLAKVNDIPAGAFLNPNTQDRSLQIKADDGRPVLASLDGVEVPEATVVDPGVLPQIQFHCSFAYDDDVKLGGDARRYVPVVYMGDRADYATGRTFSGNWQGQGMCLLWTDQHAAFEKSRTLASQSDPNMYHHNEFDGEGGAEVRDGVGVTAQTLDTHLRFFSEEEDDGLLTDPEGG